MTSGDDRPLNPRDPFPQVRDVVGATRRVDEEIFRVDVCFFSSVTNR
jgi:hypothetical protein